MSGAIARGSGQFFIVNHRVDERTVGIRGETWDDANARVAGSVVEAEGIAGRAAVEHDERATMSERGDFCGTDERRAEAAPAVRTMHEKFLQLSAVAAVGLRC